MNDEEVREFVRFAPMMRERPYGRKSRISKTDYGKLSNTSRYRQDKVAERTLVVSRMTMEEQLTELVAARQSHEQNLQHKLHSREALPRMKGRILE